jgi:Fe2+ or Zn2+ uptake regulation protein
MIIMSTTVPTPTTTVADPQHAGAADPQVEALRRRQAGLERLHALGQCHTLVRYLILTLLADPASQLSEKQIWITVRAEYSAITPGTIHRALRGMTEWGILHPHPGPDGPLYQMADPPHLSAGARP